MKIKEVRRPWLKFSRNEWATLEALTRPERFTTTDYEGRVEEKVLLVTEEEADFLTDLHEMARNGWH